jgi:hypothetical protein
MMNPLFLIARALSSILARLPPRYRCAKKDQGATSGNPYGGPLEARNRNRFGLHCLPHDFQSQFPAATGSATKEQMTNGKESKTSSPAAGICLALEAGNTGEVTRTFSAFQISTRRGIFEGVSTRARRRQLMRAEL